ncbi:MAG: ATP-binding protein [Clostridia bacterium]|nr:ATP-binding protein [Clostridia bacterium]
MRRTGTLINKTYRNLLVSTLAMTASMYLSSIVDGILVGQILGTMELSAINLTYSIYFLKNILIAMFTFGGNTLAVMYKGKRDNRQADVAFTISFWAGMLSSLVLTLIGLALIVPTASLLAQTNAELTALIAAYLIPLWVLTPLTALNNHIAAFARTDGMKKLATALPVVSNVINLFCDWLFMAVFGWGIAGAGWATVVGYLLGSLLVIAYFKGKDRTVHFTREAWKHLKMMGKILSVGMPSALIYVCNFLRLFFTNAIILSATGTVGTQIASVSFSLNSLCFIFVEGATMTLLPVLGALYGEKDIKGQRLALRYGMWVTLALSAVIFILSELFPLQLAALYNLTDPAITSVFAVTFRIVSINIPILAVIYVMRTFFQATKQKWLANIVVVLDGFAAVVPLMYAFAKVDIYWLWASFPISKAVTVLITVLIVVIYKAVKRKDNYLLIDGEEGPTLDFSIHNNVEDATDAAHTVVAFCRENGVEDNLSHDLGVAAEELCVNIAKYAAKSQSDSIDIYVKVSDKSLILKIRDNGRIFNPTEYIDDTGREVTGLMLVRSLASSIEYNRVIGFNVTVVTVNRAG